MRKSELRELIKEEIRNELRLILPEIISNTLVGTLQEMANKNRSGLRGALRNERKPVNAASAQAVNVPRVSTPEVTSRSSTLVSEAGSLKSILSQTTPFSNSEIFGEGSSFSSAQINNGDYMNTMSEPVEIRGVDGRVIDESKPEVQAVLNTFENVDFSSVLKKMDEASKRFRSNL